jgi:hypothetical protein
MAAAGTKAARRKSVPRRAATVVKVFRVMAVGAVPAIRFVGLPFAKGATDTAEIGFLFFLLAAPGWVFRLDPFLEEPERHHDGLAITRIASARRDSSSAHELSGLGMG